MLRSPAVSSLSPFAFALGLLLLFWPAAGQAQSGTEQAVATLVYFEGTVRVADAGAAWEAAQIEQSLRADQRLQTGGQAQAEIEWMSGETTVLGPNQTQTVASLFEAQKTKASGEAQGMLQRFTKLFSDESQSTTSEAGGVRRSNATQQAASSGGLHWKRHESVSFEEAAALYQSQNYAEAATKLHLFLQQSPDHPKSVMAQFALGHCYVALNNPVQARDTFEALVSAHPSDPLAERAREVLAQY